MLTKEEHINYWKREAERNWETALYLKKGSQRVMALFMLHLVTEKLLKAHWVKDNFDNQPPRTHDLQNLHNQTELDLPAEEYDYLAIVNQWSIDTRYPDYKEKIYSIASESYVNTQFEKIIKLKKCLLETL
ncbi:MAG: HEPN domain-containing protein [Cyclobacteriaceae bacterium]|nr:HEPN domain-containing protein [Cyclobacteriaceae bacterium]